MIPIFDLHIEPAFVFPGESFKIIAPSNATLEIDGIKLRRNGSDWIGRASDKTAEVWAKIVQNGELLDVTKTQLPVASGRTYPLRTADFELVEIPSSKYAAILNGKRFAELVSFMLAPRSAPIRHRPIDFDYVYFGNDRITLSGKPDGLIRTIIEITSQGIELSYSSLFDLSGTVTILDKQFEFKNIKPSETGKFSYPFP